MHVIWIAVLILGLVGLIAAVVLFVASRKFAVHEDPRVGEVAAVLPQANCGGCGYPGCSGFAGACVKAADNGSIEGLLCPVGGQPVMEKVAGILGMTAAASVPKWRWFVATGRVPIVLVSPNSTAQEVAGCS